MNKEETRKAQLKLRKSLSEQELNARSQKITNQVKELLSTTEARYVHLFLPIQRQHEVNTWPLYHFLVQSEKYIPVISKTDFSNNNLSHHPMVATDNLEESHRGIPEPLHDREIATEKLDLVFVPLIAFDLAGHRLGYGAGFYDRFLSQCRVDCLKVGLSLLPPLDEMIATNGFDIKMDQCIAPERVYPFD